MQIHIRHIARRRKGIVTESEKALAKQSITIGRATDQDIFLADPAVSYHHARINLLPEGGIGVTAVSRLGFYIEGRLVQDCLIRRAGQIIIGAYHIDIEIGPARDRVAITIEKREDTAVELEAARRRATRLDQTWLSRRQLSWLAFTLVALVGLGLPLAGYFDRDAARRIAELRLPDDRVWLSGEISAPHQYFGRDCRRCHQQPFVRVRDEACADCHADVGAHADPARFALPELHATACAACHTEHSGDAYLVRRDQVLCADCHAALSDRVDTDLADASDFYRAHPEFRPTLLLASGSARGDPGAWQRIALDDRRLRHETGLVFPHDVHVDPGGVRGPGGVEVLACRDCHRPDASGNYMIPIRMEAYCQSCHRLAFDPDDLERELPHGQLPEIRKMLREYYSFITLRGGYAAAEDAPDPVRQRRRPGKPLTRDEQRIALDWALERADAVAREVVEFRSCNLCHKVTRDAASEFGWQVPAVNTAQARWLPKGAFAHGVHRNTDCASCHDAASSAKSEDVLLPGIAVCRDCHGGQHASDRLRSTCIDCHGFHQAPHPPRPSLAGVARDD